MHVLHVHDRLSAAGGADIHLLAVAHRQAGVHRVSLAVGRVGHAPPLPDQIETHVVKGLGGRQREATGACRRFEALLRRLDPDLLHLHNVLQPEVMRAVTQARPSVATVQDHRAFCPGRGRMFPDGTPCVRPPGPDSCTRCFDSPSYAQVITALTQQRAAALRRFPAVVVLSRYMAGELRAAGVSGERIHVVPPFPWFPDDRSHAPNVSPAGPVVLAAGRLVRAKGFHVLLEAWARAGLDLPLVLAGDGPARADLEEQAKDTAGVHFTGWLPQPAIRALLGRARVAVMPSLWAEPFGIAGLEALSLGVPVIASRLGGVGEWLGDSQGWLVPPGDPQALAEALREAEDPDEAAARGRRGAARVLRDFRTEPLMQRLEAVYTATLADGPPGA